MTNEWYYAKAGKREGPVSIDDLKRLTQQGQLQPTDHVWKQGFEKWVPASSVEGLFGVEPPPLPPPSPATKAIPASTPSVYTKEGLAAWMKWLDHHKIVICVVTFIVGMSLSFLSSRITTKDAPKTMFFLIGILPACVFGIIWGVKKKKRELLHGFWQPVSGNGVYFQFTKDGALVRGDGVATRFRWAGNDKIELYVDDSTPKMTIDVLSLSNAELVLRIEGQGYHYVKGRPVSSGATGGSTGTGFFGTIFGWLFNYKCPRCGRNSGKEVGRHCLGMQQRVAGRYVNGQLEQVWVNVYGYDVTVACQECGHSWTEDESKQEVA